MKNLIKLNIKVVVILYILIDIICVGAGMGVPIFCILFGFPLGWYITKRIIASTDQPYQKYYKIFKLSLLAAVFTSMLMLLIWGWTIPKFFDPSYDFKNFGLPDILYDPKISFIGWHILMIIISPFLQLLTTIFAVFITLMKIFAVKYK
jgi:hypothetical protein